MNEGNEWKGKFITWGQGVKVGKMCQCFIRKIWEGWSRLLFCRRKRQVKKERLLIIWAEGAGK